MPIRLAFGSLRHAAVASVVVVGVERLIARGRRGTVADDEGFWEVLVTESATYDITIRFQPVNATATARFTLGSVTMSQKFEAGQKTVTLKGAELPSGPNRLQASVTSDDNKKSSGVMFVEVSRRE